MRKSKSGPLVESDDDVRLYCDVDAFPEAEIAWLKSTPGEEEQVLTLGPELAITGVEREDAGKCGGAALHCIAGGQTSDRVNIVNQGSTIVSPRTPGVWSTSRWSWKSTVSFQYFSDDI